MKSFTHFLLSTLFLFSTFLLNAQTQKQETSGTKDAVFNIKVEYFKSHFIISEKEATLFWPLFDQYLVDEKAIHKNNKEALKEAGIERINGKIEIEDLTDKQVLVYYESIFKTRSLLLELEKQFYSKLTEILESQSIIQFYNLERVFRNDVSQASKGECDIPKPVQKK